MNKDRLRELLLAECTRLAKLGVDGIVNELASRGMRGNRGDEEDCPLSRALCDTLMINGGIRVCGQGINDSTIHKRGSYVEFEDDLTPLSQFVANFDDGKFPQLES